MKVIKIPRKRDQRKKRVAAYCRVSTVLEKQEESFEAQVSYYSIYIETHREWEFAGIYSDEKSGTKAENRQGFQKLIQDALEGKIDYILVKSISRFSRNIVDCQKYVNLLKTNGVYVRFEKEGLDTADESSSMVFSFLSVIAQNESKTISDNVKWGYRQRFKRGEYNLGNNRIFGYDTVDGKLVPNRDADAVRLIFTMASEGMYYKKIAQALREAGIAGRSQKPLTSNGIRYILTNEAYIGDKKLQKTVPVDFLTKRPEKGTAHDSFYVTGDHEAIIDQELWKIVQTNAETRKTEKEAGIKRRDSRSHCLFGKIVCAECGAPMTRRTLRCSSSPQNRKTYKAWICKERHLGKYGNGCKNRSVREEDLIERIHQQSEDGTIEEILPTIERIYVGEEIKVIMKQGDCESQREQRQLNNKQRGES